MSGSEPSRAPLWAAILHSALTCVPLLFPRGFYYDWYAHLWFAAYVAHHLFGDGVVPLFVNIEEQVGNPAILFYGAPFYTAVAPFVGALGPDSGIRVAAALAILGPSLALSDIVRRREPRGLIGSCIVVILLTSIYRMTTIYSRGHVTEFFAWQLFLLGFTMILRGGLLPRRGDAGLSLLLGVVALAVAAGTHPPTTYLVVVFLPVPALLCAAWRRADLRDRVIELWPAVLVGAAAFVPTATWVALVLRHRGNLTRFTGWLVYEPSGIDHWLARLAPWPVDLRVEIDGFAHVATPYLSAPVNGLALGLVGGLAWRAYAARPPSRAGYWWWTAFLWAVAAATISALAISLPVWPLRSTDLLPADSARIALAAPPDSWLGWLFGRVNAAYRFAAIVDLLAVLTACVLLMAAPGAPRTDAARSGRLGRLPVLLVVGAAIALTGAAQKVIDVAKEYVLFPQIARASARARGPVSAADALLLVRDDVQRRFRAQIRSADRLPESIAIDAISFYAMPGFLAPLGDADGRAVVAAAFRSTGRSTYAATVTCARACLAQTTLAASPFFDLTVDRAATRPAALRQRDGLVAVPLPSGDHRLEVTLGTAATRVIAAGALADAIALWALAAIISLRTVRRTVTSTGAEVEACTPGDPGRPGREG